MKIAQKYKLSLLATTALALCSLSLRAQEENFSAQEMQELKQQQHAEFLNLEDDKTLIMEVDSKTGKIISPSTSSKDNSNTSTTSQGKSKTDSKSNTAKEKEDPLNFNFLYFIIQRFKISDIVDD
jgi:hypothetical protein